MNKWIATVKKFAQFYNQYSSLINQSIEEGIPIKQVIEMDEIKQIKTLRGHVKDLETRNSELCAKIEKLRDRFVHQNEHRKFWNNKHPKRDVKYSRPIYVARNRWEEHYISVVDFIMPRDSDILERVSDLKVENPMEINQIAPKIYQEAKKNYSYEYDSKTLGISEFWKFPPETMASNGDCEDWAHLIASFLIGAGVPSWRVRVTYGIINSGGAGHSTVYVLDDDMETWRHLNSTSPSYDYDNLPDYPKFGDKDDKIGIDPERCWGSFNNKFAWMELENKTSKEKFEQHKISDRLEVS